MEGYKWHFNETVLTVWSAPNYCYRLVLGSNFNRYLLLLMMHIVDEFLNECFIDSLIRCGNVAAILELDEHLKREFTIFEAAPQESRGIPSKKPQADYFL